MFEKYKKKDINGNEFYGISLNNNIINNQMDKSKSYLVAWKGYVAIIKVEKENEVQFNESKFSFN